MPGYGGAASAGASAGLDNQPPEETVALITSMGFHRNQALQALRATVSLGRLYVNTFFLLEVVCVLSVATETFQCPLIVLNHVCLMLYPTMPHKDLFVCSIYKAKIND